MSLINAYLNQERTQRTLRTKPGQRGFSLIELVVVIAVLAVLTAIALPNFLGVTEDASARTAQQGVLNAYKECKVFWARNKRDHNATVAFNKPAITSWRIFNQDAVSWSTANAESSIAQSTINVRGTGTNNLWCFTTASAERTAYAIPDSTAKFPSYRITVSGDRECINGTDSTTYPDTYDIGCDGNGAGATGSWK